MNSSLLAKKWKMEDIPLEEEPMALPVVKSLSELKRPNPTNDENELIKNRFLSRGGGLILVGQTGIGKSSLVMQLAISFALEKSLFGIAPARPLRVLLIQAENDEGDLAEMRDGVIDGMALSLEDKERAMSSLRICTVDDRAGLSFTASLDKLLELGKYDLVIIDPLFAYCEGDISKQENVSLFLRQLINPILHNRSIGCIFVHHVNKPPSGSEKSNYTATDFAYSGAGSAELANWMRAGIYLRSIGSSDVFELRLTKRGSRVKWKDAEGKPTVVKFIRHSRRESVICWDEVTEQEAREIATKTNKQSRIPAMEQFLDIFPKTYTNPPESSLLTSGQIQNEFKKFGWPKDSYSGLCDEALSKSYLGRVDGLPRNRKLWGLPHIVAAYHKAKLEHGTILEQPPLPKGAK